jgi:hypothetical protein
VSSFKGLLSISAVSTSAFQQAAYGGLSACELVPFGAQQGLAMRPASPADQQASNSESSNADKLKC